MERTDKLNQLRQFNRPWEYDCCDIAEKLVELSNLPDDGQLKNELTDALYYLKAVAENPYNSDYEVFSISNEIDAEEFDDGK